MTEGHRVAELFAGVGGFRLGLERAGWDVVWSNQWEPSTKLQHASECYEKRFGPDGHINDDIAAVLDSFEAGQLEIPDVDLLCGGFPCQDYSVAKTLNQAAGIQGKKGVLWWEIVRFLRLKRPTYLLLENVDRLLKSPATQRGRDFAVMLACLNELGYLVEWRVVNAADYGAPQKRRRVFIAGWLQEGLPSFFDGPSWLTNDGVLAKALPARATDRNSNGHRVLDPHAFCDFVLDKDLVKVSETFGGRNGTTPFLNAGVAVGGQGWTRSVTTSYRGKRKVLRDVLQQDEEVDDRFFVPRKDLKRWRYLKGAKQEQRSHTDGGTYFYSEGAIPFPDSIDEPARTILTGEGGRTPSRFKHIIRTETGRYRRLTPIELERLNGFPEGWTDTGMSDGRRAFVMGNALVIGLVERIGKSLMRTPAGRFARGKFGRNASAGVS